MRALLIALALAGCQRVDHGPMVAIDGDTIRHGAERLRIVGMDAPEMPGHCRPGRRCVAGDPYASRDALQAVIDTGIQCDGDDRDVYGRRLVNCWLSDGTRRSVALWMIENGYAEPYRPRP